MSGDICDWLAEEEAAAEQWGGLGGAQFYRERFAAARAEIERLRDEVDIKECRVETLSNQIEQLRAELDAVTDLRSQMTIILHRIGVALYGDGPDTVWWSWHDLPERVAAERALADQLADAILSASVEEAIEKTDASLAAYQEARRG